MQDAVRINFLWLLRLRWGAIVGQLITILGVQLILGISLPLRSLFTIIGVEAASNIAGVVRAARPRPLEPWLIGGVLTADVLLPPCAQPEVAVIALATTQAITVATRTRRRQRRKIIVWPNGSDGDGDAQERFLQVEELWWHSRVRHPSGK